MRLFHQQVTAQPLVSNFDNTSIAFTSSTLNFDHRMPTLPRDINITPTGNQTLNLNTNRLSALASMPLTLGLSPCLGPLVFFLALGLAFRILYQQNRRGFFNHQHPAAANLNTIPNHHTAAPAA